MLLLRTRLRRQRSFGALRLAEGNADDAMAAAREQAEKLKEQAAALREGESWRITAAS